MTISPKFELIDEQPFVLLVSDRNTDQVLHIPYDELSVFIEKLRKIDAKVKLTEMDKIDRTTKTIGSLSMGDLRVSMHR